MLGMNTYSKDYIARCRSRVAADLEAYRSQFADSANSEFEWRLFNTQVQLLDYMFVHRLSGIEGKDGNPLNEVRILSNSILYNAGKLQIEKLADWPKSAVSSLTLPPDRSVLGLRAGDEVRLTEADFVRLSDAFFAEIETRYG